jgi:hypothetical protein
LPELLGILVVAIDHAAVGALADVQNALDGGFIKLDVAARHLLRIVAIGVRDARTRAERLDDIDHALANLRRERLGRCDLVRRNTEQASDLCGPQPPISASTGNDALVDLLSREMDGADVVCGGARLAPVLNELIGETLDQWVGEGVDGRLLRLALVRLLQPVLEGGRLLSGRARLRGLEIVVFDVVRGLSRLLVVLDGLINALGDRLGMPGAMRIRRSCGSIRCMRASSGSAEVGMSPA